MARMIFLSAPHPALSHLFTIDHAVGLNGANHRNDVLLVQFFLRALIPTPPGAPTIPFDGHCGRQTINWIRYFQAAYCDDGPGVREAGQRGGDQNNLKQIGLAAHNSDGSVRFIGGQNNLRQIGLATHNADGSVRFVGGGGSTQLPAVQDGTSNTIIVGGATGTPNIQDGSSNTIVVGEQPPANADPHVHQHYGTVRPPHDGEPFDTRMTIVRLNWRTATLMDPIGSGASISIPCSHGSCLRRFTESSTADTIRTMPPRETATGTIFDRLASDRNEPPLRAASAPVSGRTAKTWASAVLLCFSAEFPPP